MCKLIGGLPYSGSAGREIKDAHRKMDRSTEPQQYKEASPQKPHIVNAADYPIPQLGNCPVTAFPAIN
jgi:hypothetical protein